MAKRLVLVIHGEDFPIAERIPLSKWQEIQRITGRKAFDLDLEDFTDADAVAANCYLAVREKYPDRSEGEVATFVGTLELGVNVEARADDVPDGDALPPTPAEQDSGEPSIAGSTG